MVFKSRAEVNFGTRSLDHVPNWKFDLLPGLVAGVLVVLPQWCGYKVACCNNCGTRFFDRVPGRNLLSFSVL